MFNQNMVLLFCLTIRKTSIGSTSWHCDVVGAPLSTCSPPHYACSITAHMHLDLSLCSLQLQLENEDHSCKPVCRRNERRRDHARRTTASTNSVFQRSHPSTMPIIVSNLRRPRSHPLLLESAAPVFPAEADIE